MHIVIVNSGSIPALKYGGTERVVWYLGKELAQMGHKVSFLTENGQCSFAQVFRLNRQLPYDKQIPADANVVHFNFMPAFPVHKPYIVTMHGNCNDQRELDINTVFVSKNHAQRFNSESFVYNGLDWTDYGTVELSNPRKYFHFLGKAAWRIKNVQGAIDIINALPHERLYVLGGHRLNFKMGFRFTPGFKTRFMGMVGGERKNNLLRQSKGLIFPVRWHEPFGLALIESLYFGCPVFGTPYGSLPEIITPDFGFLSNKIHDHVQQLTNINTYSRKHCHDYAVEMFNSKKMALAYIEKYEQVLNGKTLNEHYPKLKEVQKEKFLEWG